MNSVMLAADCTAIEEDRCPRTVAQALPAKPGAPLLHQVQGLAAGLFFLAARAPAYAAILLFGALVSLAGAVLYVIQAVGPRLTRPAGAVVAAAALALVCIAGPQRARADTVTDTSLLQQTTMVFGQQQTNLYSFAAPGAGTLSITMKDLQFPLPLQQLTASIMGDDQVLGSWTESSATDPEFDVTVSGSGTFDAFVEAVAGNFYGLQFGAYSMSIDFQPAGSPVPLPPALDLLLGGMGLLGAMTLLERISRRRNTDVISVA